MATAPKPAAPAVTKPVVLPPRTPAFIPEVPVPVTPKVTVVAAPKLEECPYLGPIEPEPVLPESTRLEMAAGRETLRKHAESRAAALERREVPEEAPPDDIVKRDPTHVSNFRWTPEQQRARSV